MGKIIQLYNEESGGGGGKRSNRKRVPVIRRYSEASYVMESTIKKRSAKKATRRTSSHIV